MALSSLSRRLCCCEGPTTSAASSLCGAFLRKSSSAWGPAAEQMAASLLASKAPLLFPLASAVSPASTSSSKPAPCVPVLCQAHVPGRSIASACATGALTRAAGPCSLQPPTPAPLLAAAGKQLQGVSAPSSIRAASTHRLLSSTRAAASPAATEESGQESGQSPEGAQQGRLGPYLLEGGAYVLPHPEKMTKGGEDWFFISDTMRALGVADGVGGWAEVGVDAGAYARQLMAHAKEESDKLTADGSSEYQKQWQLGRDTTPLLEDSSEPALQQQILEKAYSETKVRGSSTASIVVLANKKLFGSNLGDSGFMIIRNGEVVFHSPSQQHGFNFPFQIGSFDSMSDSPSQAQRFSVPVELGDVIVLGTDGLWDNCFDEEITAVIKYCVGQQGSMSMDKVAQVLAFYARHRAADPKYASPFAYAAFQADLAYMGGKLDDITVVVARVADAQKVTPVPGSGGFDFRLNPVAGSPAPSSKL